jgi:hypothetical protein
MRFTFLALVAFLSGGAAADLQQLSFLSGCWAAAGVEEVWLKPEGGSMMGLSRTVKGGKTVFTEFLYISTNADGGIVLNVQLKLAGKSTQFTLAEATDGSAMFSNPQHDYPQRIIYRRQPGGSLFARIEGTVNGKDRHDDFIYVRSKCGN